MSKILNLENVNRMDMNRLADEYNLCVNNNHYLYDGDLEDLFYDSKITVGKTLYKAKDWRYDEDGCCLIGCEEGDYLETIELIQDGKIYLCQVFCEYSGCCPDYMLALLNVSREIELD